MKKLYYLLVVIVLNNCALAQCFNSLSTKYNHVAAKKTDGSLWVWGFGNGGRLGNDSEFDEYAPITFGSGSNWQSFSTGLFTTFGIKSNGTLWGCGGNDSGQLGTGTTIEANLQLLQIGTASNWKTIEAGDYFTVAIKTNNTLWAWGWNFYNQLGDGTTTDSNVPKQISPDTDWKQISLVRWGATFAIKNNGTMWCWGDNVARVLGDDSISRVTTPTQHNPDTNWSSVAGGIAHAIGLKTNGTIWGWGNYGYGETGIDLNNPPIPLDNSVPLQIGTASNWQAIFAGIDYSMAIKTDGTLWAWGRNYEGQLGDGTLVNKFVPTQIGTDTNWATVACGRNITVALKTDGSLWAWGDNQYGQFGDGTTDSSSVPKQILYSGCTLNNEAFAVPTNKIKITPNPAKNATTVQYSDLALNATIELYDLTGRLLDRHKPESVNGNWDINTALYPAGVYLVITKDNDRIISQQKLIIE